jgi:isochorismate synthase
MVVLAQQTQLNFTAPLSVSATLATLHERCGGEATVFAFDFAHGCFLGATPETLLRKQGLALHSEALAGSAQAQDAEAERALLSSSKDREEHRVVVQAIAEALGPLCDEIEFEDEPGIRRLRHLLHLHTPITAELSTSCHVLDLVARLHPTPAVGGAPTHWAVRWIAEHESVPRGWYAGPIGWFNAAGDGEFDVALRSGVIHGQEANLYAGAGIVAGSDAQHERAETELKLASLWDALRTA